jgi:hypothetical protein
LMDLYPGVLLNPVEEFRGLTIAITVGHCGNVADAGTTCGEATLR